VTYSIAYAKLFVLPSITGERNANETPQKKRAFAVQSQRKSLYHMTCGSSTWWRESNMADWRSHSSDH